MSETCKILTAFFRAEWVNLRRKYKMGTQIKFTNPRGTDFYRTVTKRVENYFAEQGISQNADGRMVFKTIVMFSLYLVPYILMLSISMPLWLMWSLTAVMGLGLSGIGMSVMHDANHGAYSEKRWVNQLLGYSLDLIGGNSFNWKIQHNIKHHTFTNISGHDQDIRDRMNLRFTPVVKKNWLHRFQVFYAFVFYGLQTLLWALLKDFAQLYEYGKAGDDKQDPKERRARLLQLIGVKVVYIFFMLVLPTLVLHIPFWQVFVGFLTMHVVAGLILTTVFQLAHVVEDTAYPELDAKGNINEEWAIHQMQTTVNFAPKNKLVTFFVGGLNFQVEHHLFQRICHVHYPDIAPIVKQAAEEYGIPYKSNDTFRAALVSHVRLLHHLGVSETFKMATEF